MFLSPLSTDTLVKPFPELEYSSNILGQSDKCCCREEFYLLENNGLCVSRKTYSRNGMYELVPKFTSRIEHSVPAIYFLTVALSLEILFVAFLPPAV